jgi:hypothetical protein
VGLAGCDARESGAQQRRRIDRGQVVRDRHKPTRLCDHHFGISAIMMNAGIFLVPTVHEMLKDLLGDPFDHANAENPA